MKSTEALLQYMKQHDLDAFFLAKKQNIRYISGYTGDDSYLVITPNKFYFLTDPRYTEQAALAKAKKFSMSVSSHIPGAG